MKSFIFGLLILGGLMAGGLWLKKHFQAFVQDGLANGTQQKDEQKKGFPRDHEENEEDAARKNEEDNPTEADIDDETIHNIKVRFTQEPNSQKIKKGKDRYEFSYTFRDTKQKGLNFQWVGDKKLHDKMAREFGLPKDFFDGKYNQKQIDDYQRKGYFRQAMIHGKQFTIPDYNRIANRNKPITLPIYQMLRKYLGNNTSHTSLIAALMVFCQDIPYKRPPSARNGKYISEIDVPAKMLTGGTGDCDTKSVFFASVLLHQPSIKVAVVLVDNPSHMFAAIRGVPTAYQAYITYQGEKYIVCEPVGNARLPIGQLGFKDCQTKLVVPIKRIKS